MFVTTRQQRLTATVTLGLAAILLTRCGFLSEELDGAPCQDDRVTLEVTFDGSTVSDVFGVQSERLDMLPFRMRVSFGSGGSLDLTARSTPSSGNPVGVDGTIVFPVSHRYAGSAFTAGPGSQLEFVSDDRGGGTLFELVVPEGLIAGCVGE